MGRTPDALKEDTLVPFENDEFPPDSPQTEIVPLVKQQDPEELALFYEKAVKYGQRIIEARNKLIQVFTYAKDWHVFGAGEKAVACLSANGAIRVARNGNFPIQFSDVKYKKEVFEDEYGKGYRYTYEGWASMGGCKMHSIGQYSTRDLLLGKKQEGFRDIKDINESYIQKAAHTYFKGNAIKDLLGLKGMPADEYGRIRNIVSNDADKTSGHTYNQGAQGGKTEVEEKSEEVAKKLCSYINQVVAEGQIVFQDEQRNLMLIEADPMDSVDDLRKKCVKALTSGVGKDGKVYEGFESVKDLITRSPVGLKIAYGKMKKLMGE